MAGKNRVEVEIAATYDDAEAKAAIKDADKIDKLDPEIEVSANVSQVLDAFDDVISESKQVQAAADALGRALGPELAAKADTVAIVQSLQRAGVTLEEITDNADKLGAKLREAADADIGGKLGRNLGTARGQIDEVSGSARGANSALANMVGNSAQDLGAMAGIAGSAGVAIGQMAEYASDARLEGESLGSSLLSMAKVVGPILFLTTAVAAVGSVLGEEAKAAKESEERTKSFGKAMRDTGDDALGFTEVMRGNEAQLRDFAAEANDAAGGFGIAVDRLGEKVPVIGKFFDRTSTDIIQALGDANLSIYDMGGALDSTSQDAADFNAQLDEAKRKGKITEDQYRALKEAVREQGEEVLTAKERQILYNVSLEETNALIDEIVNKQAPLDFMPDTWKVIFADIRDGKVDTEEATAAINTLSDALGLPPQRIIELALAHDKEAKAQQGVNDAMGDYLRFLRERHNAALPEIEDFYKRKNAADAYAESLGLLNDAETKHQQAVEQRQSAAPIVTDEELQNLGDAVEGLHNLAESLDEIEAGALADVFDIGNTGVDTLTATQNLNQGLRDLVKFIQTDLKGVIPDTLDPNDINADDFLNKFGALRGPLQKQLERTFTDLGAEAALAQANSYVNTIAAQTGISREEVRNLLGIPDLEFKFKFATDEADTEKARRLLDILGKFPDADLRKQANLSLQLELGLISPQNALTILQTEIERELEKDAKKHVEISTVLRIPDNTDEVRAAAERDFTNDPAELPVVLSLSSAEVTRLQALMQLALGQNFAIPGGSFPMGNVTNNTYYPPGVEPTPVNRATIAYGRLNGVRAE